MADKMIQLFPSPKLSPTEYVPGLGAAGAEFPEEKAEALLAAGLAVKSKPNKPGTPAEKSEG
jgi:hypothetical protein